MSQFVLMVDLEIKPESIETYLVAAREQAENTILEPGCHRFDIIRSIENASKFTHYEIFENAEAFQAHTQMPHTQAFGAKVTDLIIKTDVRQGTLAISVG